ncbi:hypothetical protein TNCV_3617531 [Trichonephila clavipes]|nr:hypothetical protein TNCV_3617531 [Trichonephila clavipes]
MRRNNLVAQSCLCGRGGTLNSRRATSRVVGGRGKEVEGTWPPPGFSPSKLGGTEQNRTVTCMVLKAKANGRCKDSSP